MLRPWNVNMQHSSGFSQRILWFVILEQGCRASWHSKAFQQQRRKSTLIIHHCSLWINPYVYINLYISYIYMYIDICTCIQVVKGRYTRYLRIILCGAVWVPVPETFRIYSLFLPATLCLVHRETNGKTLHLSKIACSIALPATSLPTGLLCSKTMNLRKQGSCIPPKDLLPEEFLEYPWGPGILRGNFEHTWLGRRQKRRDDQCKNWQKHRREHWQWKI